VYRLEKDSLYSIVVRIVHTGFGAGRIKGEYVGEIGFIATTGSSNVTD
jgi:hypothetical protein